jgi:ABC-2 type transport system ATP-binding protein
METRTKFRRNSVQVAIDGELGDLPGVIDRKVKSDCIELILAPDTSSQSILDQLRERGTNINRFEVTTPSLNEIFLDLVKADHE